MIGTRLGAVRSKITAFPIKLDLMVNKLGLRLLLLNRAGRLIMSIALLLNVT